MPPPIEKQQRHGGDDHHPPRELPLGSGGVTWNATVGPATTRSEPPPAPRPERRMPLRPQRAPRPARSPVRSPCRPPAAPAQPPPTRSRANRLVLLIRLEARAVRPPARSGTTTRRRLRPAARSPAPVRVVPVTFDTVNDTVPRRGPLKLSCEGPPTTKGAASAAPGSDGPNSLLPDTDDLHSHWSHVAHGTRFSTVTGSGDPIVMGDIRPWFVNRPRHGLSALRRHHVVRGDDKTRCSDGA